MVDVRKLYRQMAAVLDKQTMPPMAGDFDFVRSDIKLVLNEIRTIDERTYEADSPWHAAIFCMNMMADLASGEPLDESREHIEDVSQLTSTPAMHLVFRGEGDYTNSLCPAYWRTYNDDRRPELSRSINNFAQMLKYASDQCFTNIPGGNPNFKFDQFVGAAQHYLGNTPLMDWTTDPCVGVGFGADYDEKANYSVVYALPAYRAVEHNAAYYLPPPFVERLYLQRGFFIETAKPEDDKSLQKACLSIRFKENRNFKVIRNGVEIPNLMKPLAVLDNLAIHAKEQSVNGVQFINEETENVEEAAQILQDEWNKIGGIPDVLQSDKAEQHAETWRESLLEMIERLTHLRTKEGLKVSEHLLNPVVCSNVQMMKSLKTWLRIQEKWARDEAKREDAAIAWGQRADLLDRSLNSIH